MKTGRTSFNAGIENNFGFPIIGDLYNSIDLLVIPHQEEMLNVTALEAAYCGTPMIVASGGATEEYLPDSSIRPQKTDIFVAPPLNTRYTIFDAEEIAEKIIVASLQGKCREKSHNFIQDNCSLNKVMNKWISLLSFLKTSNILNKLRSIEKGLRTSCASIAEI